MKTILKCILLIISPVLFAASCSKTPAEDVPEPNPEVSDNRLYFKNYDQQSVNELVTGYWKTLPEGLYLNFGYRQVIAPDTVYLLGTVTWEKNDYGFEWYYQSGVLEETFWLISINEGRRDTLHYTSPGYPPLNSWTAVKIDAEEYEKKRQEVLLNRHLQDAACPLEAVSGSRIYDDIIGQWKLIKDTETGIDYSCDEIIYDFLPDSVLTITSNRSEYPATTSVYDYLPFMCPAKPYHPEEYRLTIDGELLRSEVLEKIMFLGDEANPSAKVFIRIN
jgi:hypothetical protein